MHGGALEAEIRTITGVVSCAIAPNGIFVLVDVGADARAIERASALVAERYDAGAVHVLVPPGTPALRLAGVRAVARSPRTRAIAIAAASIGLLVPLLPIASNVMPSNPPLAVRPVPGAASASEVLVGGPAVPGPGVGSRGAGRAAGSTRSAPVLGGGIAPGTTAPASPPAAARPAQRRPSEGAPAAPESCRHDNGRRRGWTEARGKALATHRPECVPAGAKGGRWE